MNQVCYIRRAVSSWSRQCFRFTNARRARKLTSKEGRSTRHLKNKLEFVSLLAHEDLSFEIIGLAMGVHRDLGPGVDELFHHEELVERLVAANIEHLYKPRKALIHRERIADIFEPDLVIPDKLICELKRLTGAFAKHHFVQVRGYLKFWGIADSLLLDFGKESLIAKRYIFRDGPVASLDVNRVVEESPPGVPSTLSNELAKAIARLTAQYGAGYRDKTYFALLDIDLRCEGLGSIANPIAAIRAPSRYLGSCRLPCLAVENQCAIMVLSQRDNIRAADRAILRSWLKHLGFGWGLIVNFGKTDVELRWVAAKNAEKLKAS